MKNAETEATELMVIQSEGLMDMAAHYHQMMCFYEAGIHLLNAKLQILRDEFQCSNDRNPIETIKSRIKTPESIGRKISQKNISLLPERMLSEIHDIAGIRVICPFISDVYYVAEMLLKQKDIELVEQKDYITKPKENGYRSLHLIVLAEVFFSNTSRKIPVEIQFRTIAMNCWASLEHQLRYKKEHEFTEEMNEELKRCAEQMADSDTRMQKLAARLPSFL